jgi:hypothetical protein
MNDKWVGYQGAGVVATAATAHRVGLPEPAAAGGWPPGITTLNESGLVKVCMSLD